MVEFRILRERRRVPQTPLTSEFGLFKGLCLLGGVPWDNEAWEEPSPSSRTVHSNEQEAGQKCQQACMDKQGAPGKTQTQKQQREGESKDTDRKVETPQNTETLSECAGMTKGKVQLESVWERQRQPEGFL